MAGRAEVGSPSSVHLAIRDLGAPPPDEFAVLNTILRLWGGEFYDIGTDALYLYYSVWNSGLVAASPTQAILFTTPDLFSEDAPFERELYRIVPKARGALRHLRRRPPRFMMGNQKAALAALLDRLRLRALVRFNRDRLLVVLLLPLGTADDVRHRLSPPFSKTR